MDLARVARITTGSTLIMAGTMMLVLPGPGLITIAAGLHLLSKDIAWADRAKRRLSLRPKAWGKVPAAERSEAEGRFVP